MTCNVLYESGRDFRCVAWTSWMIMSWKRYWSKQSWSTQVLFRHLPLGSRKKTWKIWVKIVSRPVEIITGHLTNTFKKATAPINVFNWVLIEKWPVISGVHSQRGKYLWAMNCSFVTYILISLIRSYFWWCYQTSPRKDSGKIDIHCWILVNLRLAVL
jgi:hypothetical protein